MEVFKAIKREGKGKGEARKLRRSGYIPAIIYGGEAGNIPVAVWSKGAVSHLKGEVSEAKIWKLEIEGEGEKNVIIKDVQRHPVTGEILHVDFYEITYGKLMSLLVPLSFVGEPIGVKKGGVLEVLKDEVEIECLPKDIVEELEVDVSFLDIGDTLFVRDIKTPEGIRITEDLDQPVVTIVGPEEEEEVAEEAEESMSTESE